MHGRHHYAPAAATLATILLAAQGFAATRPKDTPIEHVIVIFQENVSFDHYFGTYPNAANDDPSEPQFTASAWNANGQRPDGSTPDQQPQRRQPVPFHACTGRHL